MGALDRVKQADEQQRTTEMLETLISQHDVDRQQIAKLTKTVADLTGYVKVMDEEQTKRLDQLSTSPHSDTTSTQITSVESRLSEIEKTLGVLANSIDGKNLLAASQSLVAEAQRNHAGVASAIEKLKDQADENKALVSRIGNSLWRSAKLADEKIASAVEQVAGEASTVVTRSLDSSNDRAEKIMAATMKLEARRLWSVLGSVCLALVPLAAVLLVVGGLTMGLFHALGVGPLLGWAWDSFVAAPVWWQKALIALGSLSGTVGFGWLVWWLARKMHDDFGRW